MDVAEALKVAADPETWKAWTADEKEALLALTYHAIDDLSSGFESQHAKTILGMLAEMQAGARSDPPAP